jgi:hypothetical protein
VQGLGEFGDPADPVQPIAQKVPQEPETAPAKINETAFGPAATTPTYTDAIHPTQETTLRVPINHPARS